MEAAASILTVAVVALALCVLALAFFLFAGFRHLVREQSRMGDRLIAKNGYEVAAIRATEREPTPRAIRARSALPTTEELAIGDTGGVDPER